jgi:hypothetical protein
VRIADPFQASAQARFIARLIARLVSNANSMQTQYIRSFSAKSCYSRSFF